MNNNQKTKRISRLIRLAVVAVSAIMLFSMLALFAFAADSASPYDAQFGGLYYENLSDAIAAANASECGGTVTLLRDTTLAECLTVSKNVTLTGKYTIYRADTYTAGLFVVASGATLTLDGGITIDGGNEWVLDYDAFHTDIQKEEFLVSGMSYVTAEPSAPVATAHMISIYGSLVMNNATVQNNYGGTSLTTAPFRLYQGATLTMNDGAVARHNYINGDSALVHCNSRYATWTINDGAEITENYSTGIGGLSFFYYSYVEMNGGEMHDNYVCGKEGSIFKLYNGARFTMNDGYIHDNYAFAMSGAWGGTISVHYTSDAATTGNYSTFTMNGGVVGPNYGNGQTTLVGNGYNKPCLYLNGGKVINVDGYNGASGSYLYYTADSGVMEGGTIEGDSVDIRKDFTNNGTINSNVNLINKANATVYGNGVVNGNLYLDPDKNTVSACILGCTWNGDVILSDIANAVLSGGTYNGNIIVPDGANLSITGGQFKNSPVEYLAAGSQSFYDSETGLYSVYSGNVASFGGTEYATLAEAITAANTAGGGEVSLLRPTYLAESISISSDITLSGAYSVVRSDSYTGNLFTVAAGATLTLDGGITIDGNNDWVLEYDALYNCMMNNGANVGTTDFCTAEQGAPVASAHVFSVSGNVEVNDATIKNHYAGSTSSISIFNVVSGGSVVLNSGAIITHNATLESRVISGINAGGSFVINDGAEISYNHSDYGNSGLFYVGGSLTVNGGDIHHNTQAYGGGTFAYIAGKLVINDGHFYENMDVNGEGATSSLIYSNTSGITLIMNGGLIEKNYSNGATTIYIKQVNSVVELNGGIIRQEHRANPGNYTSIFNCSVYFGEDMVIEGGILRIQKDSTIKGTFNGTVQFGANVTDVDGGEFNGDVELKNKPTMTISGGIWNGNITVDAGGTLSITGGLFKQDPSAYLADYYEAIYDASTGFYTVNKYYEASFDGVNYDTLEEAIAAANTAGGGEVTLLHDADLNTSITVSSDILLSGAYSVVRSDSYTGNLFTVAAGATLTLDGGIIIDGGNEWTIDYDLLNECMLANGSTSVATSFATPEAGAPIATDYMFNISGAVIMNNATVKNNYQTTGAAAPFYVSSGATLTMNDGAVATHNCSLSSNSVAKILSGAEWIINEGAEVSYNHGQGNGGVSYVNGHVIMNGGEVHNNTLYTGAGSFLIMHSGGKFTMNGGSVRNNINVVIGNVTSGTIYVHSSGTFIMNGGVIEKNRCNRTSTIYAYANTSTVELNAGIIRHEDNTVTASASSYFAGRTVIGEDVVIDGGIIRFFKVTDYEVKGQLNCELQIARMTADLNINGTLNGRLLVYDSSNITVTGGTYLGGFKIYSGVTFDIEGGSFRENPSEWLAEGYGAVYDLDSEMYDVELTPVAAIGETKYDTITEALDAAVDGDVIKISASHKIRESITVAKNVTIDTGNQTIIVDKSVAVAFVIKANTTFRGNGTVNTDNGNTAVFAIGDADTEGSLTIESGSYIGDSTVASVDNGSLTIAGGDFSVNPDVAEGEMADHSALLTVSEGADASVLITGGRFRSFNPEQAGNYLEDSHDAFEESDDYYSILTHLFEHYISDGNATCTSDGTKTAKCKFCELTDTITEVGSMLQHVFSHYVSDGNATCTSDGTKTAKCDRCDATYTVTDNNSDIGHSFTVYKSNGDATCEKNGTKTAKCDRCDEERTIMDGGTKLNHTYSGVTCTECGAPRIWLLAVIVLAVFAFLSFGMLLVV